jgi:A/G-specific adenine glycosylase
MPRPRRAPDSAPADRSAPPPPAARFAPRLVAWQRAHGRHDLPWQNTKDAYRIWLSEVMLQQTQVTTVIPYYERFTAAFPDVATLAAAPLSRVLEHWSGLGYYRRAHHLHAAARAVVAGHGGAFPTDAALLASLPGIGRSTAAAVATFAGGAPAPILDGNVKRVLARHRGVDGYPGNAAVEKALWAIAEAALPAKDAIAYTQGLMDLGATVCTKREPRCDACPVAADCVARATGRTAVLPAPRPRKPLPLRTVRMLVIERAGEILLERRNATGIWAGLWSLPELAPEDDVVAHCRGRFGADVAPGAELPPIAHGFTHYRLTILPQRVAARSWPPHAEAPGRLWLTRDDALHAALPAPIRRLLQSLSPSGA